jgi:hypothetical protein
LTIAVVVYACVLTIAKIHAITRIQGSGRLAVVFASVFRIAILISVMRGTLLDHALAIFTFAKRVFEDLGTIVAA